MSHKFTKINGPQMTMDELRCPRCGRPEVDEETGYLFIRGYKVDNSSECLVCNIWFDEHGKVVEENARPSWRLCYNSNGTHTEMEDCDVHGWVVEDLCPCRTKGTGHTTIH